MRIFANLFQTHLKDMFRDKIVLFWFFLFPLFMIFLYGLIYSGNGTNNFKITINAPESSNAVRIFAQIPVFNITHTSSRETALEELNRNKSEAAVIVETDSTGMEKVIVHYKNSQDGSGAIVAGIIKQVLTEADLQYAGVNRHYEILENIAEADSFRMIDYITPGILAMAIMQLGLFGSMQLVTYREKKITKRLALAPINKASFLGSEIFLRMLMAVVQGLIILTIGHLVFKVPIQGSLLALTGIILLGAAVFISLGYLVCSFARTSEAANGLIQAVQFPMMFLSGIFFPTKFLPTFMQPIIRLMPLTYFGDGLRQIVLGGVGDFSMVTNMTILSGWLVITFILTVKFFRWE